MLAFGGSVPFPDADSVSLARVRLRAALLAAGGTQDVRGWGAGLLGPKAPDLEFTRVSSDSIRVAARRYVPFGGFSKATGSLELHGPLPFFGGIHRWHTFLDAGRVWNPDDRFRAPGEVRDRFDEERVFFGTGAGVEITSPIGPVRLSLGYKLNPSALDLRDPADVAQAILSGGDITSVPTQGIRRFHLHLSIGRTF